MTYYPEWMQLSFADQLENAPQLFNQAQLLELFMIDRQTLKRWKSKDSAPYHARRLHWIAANGYLPDSKAWTRLYIDSAGKLHTSLGVAYSPGEIESLHWKNQLVRELNRKIRVLEFKLNEEREKNRFYGRLITPANDAFG